MVEKRREAACELKGAKLVVELDAPAHQEIVAALADAMTDEDIEVRRCATISIGNVNLANRDVPGLERFYKTKVVPQLIQALRVEDHQLRENTIWALGSLGSISKEAVPALLHLLQDESEVIRRMAAMALEDIGE